MRNRRLAIAAATGALALTALGAPAFAAEGPTTTPPADGQAFGQEQAAEGMSNGRGGFRRLPVR